jgi:DNA-binding transcriptional regulator YiaG
MLYINAMRDITDVFSIWPSQADMARDLGLPYQTVAKWHQRERIPQENWLDVIEAAARREKLVTAADLLRVNNRRQSTGARA